MAANHLGDPHRRAALCLTVVAFAAIVVPTSDVKIIMSYLSYRKLVALKDKYDPANVFRFNHNIAPSKGAAKT